MLIQNRCWLCQNSFPRGKTKKVFQVSNLLTFYYNYTERLKVVEIVPTTLPGGDTADSAEVAVEVEPALLLAAETRNMQVTFTSKNLQSCLDSYVELMARSDGQPDSLFAEFKANDVEVWMSGLVCGITADCKRELAYFIEVKKQQHNANSGSGGGGSTAADKERVANINAMFSFAMPGGVGGDCPPGCGCDNPWPFMP